MFSVWIPLEDLSTDAVEAPELLWFWILCCSLGKTVCKTFCNWLLSS